MAYDLYPAIDENFNFPQVVRQALSESLELRNTVVPMTTVDRNNLTSEQRWDGRLIVNTTTDVIERYDEGIADWVPLMDYAQMVAYVDSTTPNVYQGTGAPPAAGTFKTGDIYCQYS